MDRIAPTLHLTPSTQQRAGAALIGAALVGALAALYQRRLALSGPATWTAGGATASFVAGLLLRRQPPLSEDLQRLNRDEVTGWSREQLAGLLAEVVAGPDRAWSEPLRAYIAFCRGEEVRLERGCKLLNYIAATHDERLRGRLEACGRLRDVRSKYGDDFFEWMGPRSREHVLGLLRAKPDGEVLLRIDPDAVHAFDDPSSDRTILTKYFGVLLPMVLDNPGGDWGTNLRYCVEKGTEHPTDPTVPDTEERLALYVAVRTPQVREELKKQPFKTVHEKWGSQLTYWRDVVDEVYVKNTKNFHDFMRYHGNEVIYWLGPRSSPVLRRLFSRESTRRSTLRPGELAQARHVLGLHEHHPQIVIEAVAQNPDANHSAALGKLEDRVLARGIEDMLRRRREMIDSGLQAGDVQYRFRRALEDLRRR